MPKTTATAPTVDQLTACPTRDAARALLPAALTKAQLVDIARELDMGAVSRHTKADLVERIVERAVGFRLNHNAILDSANYTQIARPLTGEATEPTAHPYLAWLDQMRAAVAEGKLGDAMLREVTDAAQALADAGYAALAA